MRFAVMGPGLMSKRQKEARKRQSFPGGLAADLSQASGVAKKAAAPKQKAKGKKAKKARQGPAPPQGSCYTGVKCFHPSGPAGWD